MTGPAKQEDPRRAIGAAGLIRRRLARMLKGKVTPAAIRQTAAAVYRNRPRCGAFARSTGQPCAAPVWVRSDGTLAKRCKNHGGPSTGPRTPEGKLRAANALELGYWRWRERRRAAEEAFWRAAGRTARGRHA